MPAFASEKLATWTGGSWTRIPEGVLTGFSQDTRTLRAGQVFVALKTERRDGHDFLNEAQQAGAVAALTGRAVAGSPLPQLVTVDPLAAFQRIAREHRREFHGTVVGVTGSVGKTSTKDLLALLLGGSPDVLATEGNLNNFIGVPLTLTKLEAAHRAAVIEAGISVRGEMSQLAEMIEPDHSIVTLVGPAHLEQLGSLEGVAMEKSRLPAGTRPGGLAVFPASCWAYAPFRAIANALVLVPESDAKPKDGVRTMKFGVFHRPDRTEVSFEGRRRFVMRRVSSGMAQNAALALALASELGVKDIALQARLEQWLPSKWRGEMRQVGEATVYCDFYNANPASMGDSIDAFNGAVAADLPRLYVLGSMEELGTESANYHRQLGRTLHLRKGDFLFAIGSQAAALREGLLENGNDAAQIAVIADVAPVRERLASFKGAAFLKGSRRYRLETILDPEAAHAAH
jgi:UDP-N-acetylmuramoyl-tripeptide--D-alanyl-D-alanine ligase